jgi:hypothetical protein
MDAPQVQENLSACIHAGRGKEAAARAAAAVVVKGAYATPPPRPPQLVPPLQDNKPSECAAVRRKTRERPSNQGSCDGGHTGASPEQLLHMVESKHHIFMSTMQSRSSQLDVVKTFWEQGLLVGCLKAVQRAKDPCLAADMLQKLSEGSAPNQFVIDMCQPAASVVYACLRCHSEAIVKATLSFLLLLLRGFGPKIVQCRSAVQIIDRRDVNADRRRHRLEEAREAFLSLRGVLQETSQEPYPPYMLLQAKEALSMVEDLQ